MILTRLKSMRLKELFSVLKVFIKRPRYIYPTYRATKKTLQICNELYPREHHKNGRENAFRHALWNYLICKFCFPISDDLDTARNWSNQITQFHEKLSPNKELAKAMDLHNNRVGQVLFINDGSTISEIIDLLQEAMKNAVCIEKPNQTTRVKKELVFINEKKKTLNR